MFNNFAKFELPAVKGDELWPDAIQSPLVVRAALNYQPNENPTPEADIFTNYFHEVVDNNTPQILNFLMTQRRNYQLGSVEFASTIRQSNELTMHYTNIQGKHEILGLQGTVSPEKYQELQQQSTPAKLIDAPQISVLDYTPPEKSTEKRYEPEAKNPTDYLIVNYRHVVHEDNDIRHHTSTPYFPTIGWSLSDGTPPYVFWASDNTQGQVESVYYDLRAIRKDFYIRELVMECWEGIYREYDGVPDTVTIELIAIKGEAPTQNGFEFMPSANSKVLKQANVFTGTISSFWRDYDQGQGADSANWTGDYLCSIRYDMVSNKWTVT